METLLPTRAYPLHLIAHFFPELVPYEQVEEHEKEQGQ
jgi:hypothetical protein